MFSKPINFITVHNFRLLYYLTRQRKILKVARIFFKHLLSGKRDHTTRLEDCLLTFTKNPRQFSLPNSIPVDIILPVYNGFDFLEKLFASIFKNTTAPFRIIIIDDCSSDKRVYPFLKKINFENPDITLLIQNKKNIGFVKSVNLGFEQTRNHFVIINTDIEVPPKWLERLMSPIFKNKDIASTTPFSNAADIYSFPGFPGNNSIFEGQDVTTLDSYFQYIDIGNKYIEIPSGVGFCMGMNRSTAEEIGMFDSETFNQGYCEENDWCMRAKKKGFRNILVPNLFVYHKQGGSFLGKSKENIMEKNYWMLIKKHHDYLPAVYDFALKNPLKPLQDFLILIITASTGISDPILIIGNSTGIKQNQHFENDPKKPDPDKKVLRLLYNKKRKTMILQYQYKTYNIAMPVSHTSSLEMLFNCLPIKTFFLLSEDTFLNSKEMKNFIYRLNKRIEQSH